MGIEKDYGSVESIDELIDRLKRKNDQDKARELTRYFAEVKLGIDNNSFKQRYVDGPNDGGIDFIHKDGTSFIIIQTKYHSGEGQISEGVIKKEIEKILNSIYGIPPRGLQGYARKVINEIKENFGNENVSLDIFFLTTGDISDEVRESIQEYVRDFREKNNLRIQIRFIPFGRGELDQLIMDYNYGFIPQLGKKKIRLRRYFYDTGEIKSLVGIAKIDEILEWFEGEWELEEALNKNVRGFLGDKKPNKEIRKSYEKKPDKFFYKHNGIVVFADKFTCKRW